MSKAFLEVQGLTVHYDNKKAVEQVSFAIQEGELACLLGPSGCGKTTILRAISGFHSISSGQILLNEKAISTSSFTLEPENRKVGMVFQDHALFPHLTLSQNINFGLRAQKISKSQCKQTVQEMLALIDMQEHADKYPHEISGGQSQRVALARALAPKPELLLLDEPFSNLDAELRKSLGSEVRDLLREQGITAIMVTHDQHEAFALGDKVGVMDKGKLLQWDSSFNLYHAPNSRFVANFIGDGVFVKGTIVEENVVITNFGEIRGQTVSNQQVGQEVELLLRPDDVKYNQNSPMKGLITHKAFKGAETQYTIELESKDSLILLVPSHEDYEIGDRLGVQIEADHLVCF